MNAEPWMKSTKAFGRAALLVVLAAILSQDARAAAPAGRYAVTTETVFDQSTGLLWQRQESPSLLSQPASVGYCEQLTLAGHSDWRLPTIKELHSLYDVRAPDPSIDPVFELRFERRFWSSTTSISGRFFAMSFGGGRWIDMGSSQNLRARCVR